jgi:hypothetical protein
LPLLLTLFRDDPKVRFGGSFRAALETEAALAPKERKRVAQGLVGKHREAREWLTKLEDQEDRARRRKRKNAKGGNGCCVKAFPEKAESGDSHIGSNMIQASCWEEASMDGEAIFGGSA